jgi:hypothetical protein
VQLSCMCTRSHSGQGFCLCGSAHSDVPASSAASSSSRLLFFGGASPMMCAVRVLRLLSVRAVWGSSGVTTSRWGYTRK